MSTADVAVIGGTGFYAFLEDAEEHAVTTPYGDPSAPVAVGTVAGRRVAFLPRHGEAARVPAAPDQLPREPLGAPLARRPPGAGAVRGGRAVATGGAGRHRGAGPARRPHQRPGVVVRRDRRGAPALRRPLLPAGLRRAGRRRARRTSRRDHGGHRGTAVLHAGRVAVVRRAGRDAHQHDRGARGGARPRAADVLRGAGPGDRHGRRRRGRVGRRPGRGVRAVPREPRAADGAAGHAVAALPDPDGCTCSTWADGIELTYEVP